MKTITFLVTSLLSGAIAGTILGLINLVIVEPFIDEAIAVEIRNAIQEETINLEDLAEYRIWQKGGEIAGGTILGISFGALFGIIFAYSRSSLLPGLSSNKKKALVLAGIMWFVLFVVPVLKYPANPPAVGDPETIYYREGLYITILAISGFTTLGMFLIYSRKLNNITPKKKKFVVSVVYASIIVSAFLILPSNPDKITVPMNLVQGFRVTSFITMSIFWGLLGIILGSFWDRLKPHETTRLTTAQLQQKRQSEALSIKN